MAAFAAAWSAGLVFLTLKKATNGITKIKNSATSRKVSR